MHITVVLFALHGFIVPTAINEEPGWLDYGKARLLGQKEVKPLAVFIGSGEKGWNQISSDGGLAKDAQKLLVDNYVCVYVDTRDPSGKDLAAAFEITEKTGIVISSHSGQEQAFRHEGNLDNRSLVRYLQKYAEPANEVRYTETEGVIRAGYYGPTQGYYHGEPVSAPIYRSASRGSC
jgi:hypothetical protein